MTRNLPSDLAVAVEQSIVRPFYAVFVDVPDDPAYVWSGVGEIEFDGQTWIGAGALGGISASMETTDGSAAGLSLTVTGIDPVLSEQLAAANIRAVRADLYVGVLDEAYATVVSFKRLSRWRVNSVKFQHTSEAAMITVGCEGSHLDQTRARVRRYTDVEQKRRFPGDKFFEYMSAMAGIKIIWGPS